MIELYNDDLVVGYHGFVNCRAVYDPIDAYEFIAVDMVYRDDECVSKVIVTREWFGKWRNRMKFIHGSVYNISWADFIMAVKQQIK